MSTCERCGQVHLLCAGHNAAGAPCGKAPIKGGAVCPTHGGSAPQVRAAADARHAADQASTTAAKIVAQWVPGDVPMHPTAVLAQTMTVTYRQAALHRSQLAAQAEGGADPYVRVDASGRQYPSPLALLEQAERRMAADMSAKAVSAGLDLALTRLAEAQGEVLVQVLQAFAGLLGHDPADPGVRAAARRALLTVEGEAA